ncbi:MAG: alpha-glucan family phosphorylase [Actinomycetota bacterium]|nr:alpha-glucan family phosphorylase [Actinomycetota bacterium]
MRALRRFTVRAALPEPLAALGELVMNLRWSWHPATMDLFESVDPDLWRSCQRDPVRLLGEVSAERLAALSHDAGFLDRLAAAEADLHHYLEEPRWYQGLEDAPPTGIAYFSPEFGITEVLPQYSGGLGILAGDHLKSASDLGVPILGVGLLYHSGYFAQSLSADGWQEERYPPIDPHGLPLTLVTRDDGTPLRVSIGLPEGRTLHAQVWKAQVGRAPLLLLDSDLEDNDEVSRQVTDRLYGGGADHRILQEVLLGIGGVRAIRAYCEITGTPAPEVFHSNEGHAGFLGVERIREYTEQEGLSFDEALAMTRAATLFTTHTPVPAGIDRFPRELIERFFGGENASPGVPVDRVLALGAESDPKIFNMAHMGLRLAQRANGVSKLHGTVSRDMFAGLWPGFEAEEVPIGSVTNGVHAPTWLARELLDLAAEQVPELPKDASTGLHAYGKRRSDHNGPDAMAKTVWTLRRTLRERLVEEVRGRVKESGLHRGATEAELGWINTLFDPDVLTIGFARRVPSYKRLTLMLRDPERLRALLLDPERPIQIVIAGKSHPADDSGKALLQQMVRFADDPKVRHRIAFLPNYDIGMAKYLYWGCDVWLNNPLRPLEACGTSGMKSALNGGLNLSIRDGWWDELYDGANGWAIPTANGVTDADRRDDLEAAALYELLETQVAPRFYDSGEGGVPLRWVEMVRHTLASLGPQVLASRMVCDYVERYYAPAADAASRLAADSYAGAREFARFADRVHKGWPLVRVVHVESWGVGDTPELGATLRLRAEVVLDGITPSDVDVQAAYGRVDDTDTLHDITRIPMFDADGADCSETPGASHFFEVDVPLERTGAFGYTVRVLPRHEMMSSPAELGLVTLA